MFPEQVTSQRNRRNSRAKSSGKPPIVTRVITLLATTALAAAVLFRFSLDSRIPVCIVVCIAAILLAVRSFITGKILYGLLFLGILGVFTPFRSSHLSYALVSILDFATLALFAASPLMFKTNGISSGLKRGTGIISAS